MSRFTRLVQCQYWFIADGVSVRASRWSQFRDLVDQKKDGLNSALGVQNYHLECNETKSWIKEKTKVQTVCSHST